MLSLLYSSTLTSVSDYWKKHSFDYTHFVGKVMSLLFNMLSRFVIAFFPKLLENLKSEEGKAQTLMSLAAGSHG